MVSPTRNTNAVVTTAELTLQEIYLSERSRVLLPTARGECSVQVVATGARNLRDLGYGLSEPLLIALRRCPQETVVQFYEDILPVLRKLVGAHRDFRPFYPNFPKQVMDASEAELFFNAIVHYWGFVVSDALDDPSLVMLPNYSKQERPKLEEFAALKWIDLGSQEDFDSILTRLVSANSSLSESGKRILQWFAVNRRDRIESLVPNAIPQKETLALLVAALDAPDYLITHVKTATDVLRVAVAMSGGDVSLAEPTRFRNFSKRERRFLLGCLEKCGSATEDMLRWKGYWIRLGEILHPGDYKRRFPKTFQAFSVLRDDRPVQTFNSRVERAIAARALGETLGLLDQRPGDFARRLDHLLRTHPADQPVITGRFLGVADRVSTPVLLQVWHHFQMRGQATERTFFPKGNLAKVQLKCESLPPIPQAVTSDVASGVRTLLVERFRKLPPLGRTYVAESLRTQIVPFALRSASKSLRTVARGSRFVLPDGDTVRFFLWWRNGKSRTDIDLSAVLFDDCWSRQVAIAYYNLRDFHCCHSGDITSAPQGACEFIDLHLPSITDRGYRYAVMCLNSFTQQPFCDLPECFGGWMMRQQPQSGEVFEARTVQDKVDVSAATKVCVPVIIDIRERHVCWADLALRSWAAINNVESNSQGIALMGRAIVGLNRPSLYDLFRMHADARGTLVPRREDAETVFDLHHGIVTPFDITAILSGYLA